jgi:hypothetical protein
LQEPKKYRQSDGAVRPLNSMQPVSLQAVGYARQDLDVPDGSFWPAAIVVWQLRAAVVSLLNGRTLGITVRAIHAAITFFGL